MEDTMRIGELAKATDTQVETIRYCEREALFVELQRKVSHYLQPILSHRFLNNLA